MNKQKLALLLIIFSVVVLLQGFVLAQDCVSLTEGMVFGEEFSNQTITLCAGTYTASEPGDFVTINASEFTLNCAGAEIVGAGNDTGILVKTTESITIDNCRLSDFGKGLYVEDVVGLTLLNISVSDSGIGLSCYEVIRGKIQQGSFVDNGVGASLAIGFVLDVENSVFEGNGIGLQVSGVESSIFRHNSFLNNSVGLEVGKSKLEIYRNLFKSEKNAGVTDTALGESTISWDYNKEGNYWSDYDAALDTDSDGIGDTPYKIALAANITAGQDGFPFVNEDFSTSAKYTLEDREGTYEGLRNGHSVDFVCDQDMSYDLVLVQASKSQFSLNNKTFTLKDKESLDLDGNGASDIILFLLKDNIESLDIKLVRLGDCINYCGDGVCLPPESAETCETDCVERDSDSDGFKVSEGDCDDNNPSAYPGAEEACQPSLDLDCDGLYGDEDPDCAGMGGGFWFFLVVLVLALGGIGYLLVAKPKWGEKKLELSKLTPLPGTPAPKKQAPKPKKKVAGLGKIKQYAKRYFAQGYGPEQVKETLKSQGWPAAKIDAAIKALSKEA